MAKTAISDVMVPEIFIPYVINRTAEKSAFFQSGIVADPGDVNMGANLTEGGNTVNMPFWNDLTGNSEELSDGASLTVDKITAGKDIAVIHFRGKAWSVNDLARQVSGDDPLRAVGNLVGDWWARDFQKVVFATLEGAFGAASMAGNVHDISAGSGAAAVISGKTFIDAAQKLGDARADITAVGMHSLVEAELLKNDLIETIRDSEGNFVMNTFLGRRVIVDDGLPYDSGTGKCTTYLFGNGAIGFREGGVMAPVETDRDILAGDSVLASRRAFVMHPRGVKWKGAAAGATPTIAELKTGTNWERVYEPKQIRIVKFVHKLSA